MELPDVQSTCPDIRINLTRVGVKNVKKLVEVSRKNKRPVIFISTFDIFVDLPGSLKGANLSRNFEAIDEVLQKAIEGDVAEIEQLCSAVARGLLDRHEYADRTEVIMRSEFMVKRETPVSKTGCHEVVKVHARAIAQRTFHEPIVRKSIGAEVTGMTACPCAQNIMAEHAAQVLHDLGVGAETAQQILRPGPDGDPQPAGARLPLHRGRRRRARGPRDDHHDPQGLDVGAGVPACSSAATSRPS